MSKRLKAFFIFGFVLAVLTGVVFRNRLTGPKTWVDHDQQIEDLNQKMKNLAEEIKSISVNKGCKTDQDCAVIGIGAQTCGGYGHYVVYDVSETDVIFLAKRVAEFNSVSDQKNILSFKVESCGKPPKKPRCYQRQCVVVN